MAGLSVVLETTHKSHPAGKKPSAQIISKATLLIHGPSKHNQASPPAAASSFLQRCCLCHRELAEGRDIYMYRGDLAFCSEECRRRQIFMDEDAGSSSSCCSNGAAAAARRVLIEQLAEENQWIQKSAITSNVTMEEGISSVG